MSSRMPVYFLLVVLIAVFTYPLIARTQQQPETPANVMKWEYKAVTLDATACASDSQATRGLNSLGQQGWELVSFEQATPAFPRDAQGSLLIAPAATGPSRGTNPPTADSFQGSIAMKLTQSQPGSCRMVLKREWHSPDK